MHISPGKIICIGKGRLDGPFLLLLALEKKLGWMFLVMSGIGFLVVVFRMERDKYPFIIYSAMLLLLIENWKYWLLPLSHVLVLDRIAGLLVVTTAVLGTSAVSWTACRYGGGDKRIHTILLATLLVVSVWSCAVAYLLPSIRRSAVTDADLRAFRWIEENVEEGAVFLNNSGDAGLWIPGIILRPTVIIYSNPVYLDESRELQLRFLPRYVYIGAKAAYPPSIILEKEYFEVRPDLCRKVYDDEGAAIFEALDPEALREYFWGLEEVRKKVELNRKIMEY